MLNPNELVTCRINYEKPTKMKRQTLIDVANASAKRNCNLVRFWFVDGFLWRDCGDTVIATVEPLFECDVETINALGNFNQN